MRILLPTSPRIFRRFCKLFTFPINFLWRKFSPEGYANHIGVNIAKDVRIYGNVSWGTEPWIITIGDGCHITNDVTFVTHDGATLLFRDHTPDLEITAPIKLGKRVYIGTRAMIMPGVEIGDDCIIAAGAIVTRDIPSGSVAAGIPAKVIKTTQEYYEKAQRNSLHLGHLTYKSKDRALREHFGRL